MQLHRIFLLFLSLRFIDGVSQNQSDYLEYYQTCNQARDAIDSEEYQKAASLFDQAFSKVEYPLAKELEKAFLNQIRLNNDEKAEEYIIWRAKLYGIGISSRRFESDSLYGYWKSISLPYEEKKQKTFNKEYQILIDSVYQVDQSLRKGGSFEYPDGLNVDSINTYFLLDLIEKMGYPTPQKVGYRYTVLTHLVFLHADFDYDNKLLGELLFKALQNGWIIPNTYAQIYDRRMNFKGENPIYYTAPFGYDNLSDQEKREVTSKREEIGLRSIEKSMKYSFDNGSLRVDYID